MKSCQLPCCGQAWLWQNKCFPYCVKWKNFCGCPAICTRLQQLLSFLAAKINPKGWKFWVVAFWIAANKVCSASWVEGNIPSEPKEVGQPGWRGVRTQDCRLLLELSVLTHVLYFSARYQPEWADCGGVWSGIEKETLVKEEGSKAHTVHQSTMA